MKKDYCVIMQDLFTGSKTKTPYYTEEEANEYIEKVTPYLPNNITIIGLEKR